MAYDDLSKHFAYIRLGCESKQQAGGKKNVKITPQALSGPVQSEGGRNIRWPSGSLSYPEQRVSETCCPQGAVVRRSPRSHYRRLHGLDVVTHDPRISSICALGQPLAPDHEDIVRFEFRMNSFQLGFFGWFALMRSQRIEPLENEATVIAQQLVQPEHS